MKARIESGSSRRLRGAGRLAKSGCSGSGGANVLLAVLDELAAPPYSLTFAAAEGDCDCETAAACFSVDRSCFRRLSCHCEYFTSVLDSASVLSLSSALTRSVARERVQGR